MCRGYFYMYTGFCSMSRRGCGRGRRWEREDGELTHGESGLLMD